MTTKCRFDERVRRSEEEVRKCVTLATSDKALARSGAVLEAMNGGFREIGLVL